jgi:hypothetical protein
MHFTTSFGCILKRMTNLRAFHRLNTHHRGDDLHIETPVMLHKTTQTGRHMQRDNLHDTAQRVFVDDGLPHFLMHRFGGGRVRAAHIVFFGLHKTILIDQFRRQTGLHCADLHHIAAYMNTEFRQQLFADAAHSHPHSGFAGAGAFQREPQFTVAIFDCASQVGMAGARCGHGCNIALFPVGPIAVIDREGNRGNRQAATWSPTWMFYRTSNFR